MRWAPHHPERRRVSRRVIGVSVLFAILTMSLGAMAPAATRPQWRASLLAKPASTSGVSLTESGLACPTESQCWLVGYSLDGPVLSSNVAEHWDGSSWTSVDLPTPAGWNRGQPRAISCVDASDCVIVGVDLRGASSGVFMDTYRGTSWSPIQLGLPTAARVSPSAISCAVAGTCMIVGNLTDALGAVHAFGDLLVNGASGFAQLPDGSAVAISTRAQDVSCPTPTWCLAVGSTFSAAHVVTPVAFTFAGSWSTASTPLSSGDTSGSFNAVSCPTFAECMAVGTQSSSVVHTGLASRLDASGWSAESVSGPGLELADVSCPTVDDCQAVGDATTTTAISTISSFVDATEVNGTWSTTSVGPAPYVDATNNYVRLSCPDASTCMSVNMVTAGRYSNSTDFYVQNAGSWTWSNVPLPAGPPDFRMIGVSCNPTAVCVAVGSTFPGPASVIGSTGGPVIEMRTGSTWSDVPADVPKASLAPSTACRARARPIARRWAGSR